MHKHIVVNYIKEKKMKEREGHKRLAGETEKYGKKKRDRYCKC